MPVNKQVLLRYQVLNRCFRNRYRNFTIDELVEVISPAVLREEMKKNISAMCYNYRINEENLHTKAVILQQKVNDVGLLLMR